MDNFLHINIRASYVGHLSRLLLVLLLSCPSLALVRISTAHAGEIPLFLGYPHIDTNRWVISNGWSNGAHQSCEWRTSAVIPFNEKIKLVLSDNGGKVRPLGCPEMHTNTRTSYGTYETRMRPASGSGLNTAFFTYVGPPTGSAEHDEIDFEFLGKDPQKVSITHYTNDQRTIDGVIDLGFDATKTFHNYGIEWTQHRIRWFVDNKLVYETKENDPIPRNKTRIYLSLWSGSEIENAWLGPFEYKEPISAEVEWVKFTPINETN